MVRGLAVFQEWFLGFENQYVLIGGTAARITLLEQGLDFRSTKDLDIVLHVEALTAGFGRKFWAFVEAGGYQQKEGSSPTKPCLYRFQKPLDDGFPYMLELFARLPDGLRFVPPGNLAPIPLGEQLSSLSAILLDEDYYRFILEGRRNRHGLPTWIGEDRLIPLKAVAWTEMTLRSRAGEAIDSRKINKHLTDIGKLCALLRPGQVITLPEKIKADLQRFVQVAGDRDPTSRAQVLRRIAAAYALNS